MTREHWTAEEMERLRALTLDPLKTGRTKMIRLIRHFKANGSVGAVCGESKRDAGDQYVSRGLARKIRDLVHAGELDWVLEDEGPGTEETLRREPANAHGIEAQVHVASQMRHYQELRDFTKTMEENLKLDLPAMLGLAPRSPRLEEHPLYVDLRERLPYHGIWSIFEQWDEAVTSVEATIGALLAWVAIKVRETRIPVLRWREVIMVDDPWSFPSGLTEGFNPTVVLNAVLDAQRGKRIEYPYLWQDNASVEVAHHTSSRQSLVRPFQPEFGPFNMPDKRNTPGYWASMHWARRKLRVRIAVGKGPDLFRYRTLHRRLREEIHGSGPVLELLRRIRESAPIGDLLVKELPVIRYMERFPERQSPSNSSSHVS